MDCRDILNLIDDFIEETLSDAEREEFEAHISICTECYVFTMTYRKSKDLTEKIISFRMPDSVERRILSSIKKEMLTFASEKEKEEELLKR